LKAIAREAMRKGATHAKIISTTDVAVDARARLKCLVPLCSCYGTHLLCPPNVISVREFEEILHLYKHALIVQIQADYDSQDKAKRSLNRDLLKDLEARTGTTRWQKRLHRLVNELETFAFKQGYRFAAGLIGGECRLCNECHALRENRRCRHPFEARPSMEALGIDVVRTCENVGLHVRLSSGEEVRWTGLILID